MRGLLCFLTLLVGFRLDAASPIRSNTPTTEHRIEMESLTAWAKENRFQARWRDEDKELVLSNTAAQLRFKLDSAEAHINGVQVWLSKAMRAQNGALYISSVDLHQLIAPILWPAKDKKRGKIRTICIDPGHGGKDNGCGGGSAKEKNLTLIFARELKKALVQAGYKVILTRDEDKFIELEERTRLANRKADLYISLHFNAAQAEAAGVEVYCLTAPETVSTNGGSIPAQQGNLAGNKFDKENVLLGYFAQRALTRNTPSADRGLRRARFVVLCEAKMPAVLIEGGFLTNENERKRLLDPAYRLKMAKAIAQAVQNYKNAGGGASAQ